LPNNRQPLHSGPGARRYNAFRIVGIDAGKKVQPWRKQT
jgi:hypothetical protein